GADGKTSTANFLSGMAGAMPPLHEIAKNVGVELPAYLGKLDEVDATKDTPAPASSKPTVTRAPQPPSAPYDDGSGDSTFTAG
ncbi:MAG: hypothetical protein NWQ16_04030, partial [Akkermansiaceae bacterium]|nr:hypothetical protein [Akkermansiaceae bacterium]